VCDDVTYVYDDVTYVYDDVTYVYDDVTYVGTSGQAYFGTRDPRPHRVREMSGV